jgi:hypothetical protein
LTEALSEGIAVVEEWMEASDKGKSVELCSLAEKIPDQPEEALSAWCGRPNLPAEGESMRTQAARKCASRARAGLLSDALIGAYTILSAAPEEIFGAGDCESSPRTVPRSSPYGVLKDVQ